MSRRTNPHFSQRFGDKTCNGKQGFGLCCKDTCLQLDTVFEPAEWKSVWQVIYRTTPPSRPPRLGEMVRLVAQLGGYVNRKAGAPPGPQTIWLGLQRMHDFALSWQLFGPDARDGPQHV